MGTKLFLFYFIDFFREREGGSKREKNINLLFHVLMHSLVDSCMCPDQGSNLQPWSIGMML